MPQTRINELKDLLDDIVIFAPEFKRDIFNDALRLELPRFDALIATLQEILIYQKREIEKKLAADPDYIVRLHEATAKKRRGEISVLSEKALAADQEKINELINKIKNI